MLTGRLRSVQRRRRDRVKLRFVEVAAPFATGLHQVDNPVFDREATSTSPTAARAVSRCRCRSSACGPNGTRETFSSGIVNPTSMAIDPEGRLYVSSRFEGTSTGSIRDGAPSRSPPISASRAGWRSRRTARCSSAIVRARSSASIERAHATPSRRCRASVAAFHLAIGPDGSLFVTAPTLSTRRRGLSNRRRTARSPFGVRHSAGRRGSRSTRAARCSSSKRWRARAVCIVFPRGGSPELVVAGPGSRRRRLRPRRRSSSSALTTASIACGTRSTLPRQRPRACFAGGRRRSKSPGRPRATLRTGST